MPHIDHIYIQTGPLACQCHPPPTLTVNISKTSLFLFKVLACHMSNSVSTLKPGMQKAYLWYKEGLVKFLDKVYRLVFLSVVCTARYYWVPFCNQLYSLYRAWDIFLMNIHAHTTNDDSMIIKQHAMWPALMTRQQDWGDVRTTRGTRRCEGGHGWQEETTTTTILPHHPQCLLFHTHDVTITTHTCPPTHMHAHTHAHHHYHPLSPPVPAFPPICMYMTTTTSHSHLSPLTPALLPTHMYATTTTTRWPSSLTSHHPCVPSHISKLEHWLGELGDLARAVQSCTAPHSSSILLMHSHACTQQWWPPLTTHTYPPAQMHVYGYHHHPLTTLSSLMPAHLHRHNHHSHLPSCMHMIMITTSPIYCSITCILYSEYIFSTTWTSCKKTGCDRSCIFAQATATTTSIGCGPVWLQLDFGTLSGRYCMVDMAGGWWVSDMGVFIGPCCRWGLLLHCCRYVSMTWMRVCASLWVCTSNVSGGKVVSKT